MFLDWIVLHRQVDHRRSGSIGYGLYAPPILDEWVRAVLIGRDSSVPPDHPTTTGRRRSSRSPEQAHHRRDVEMRPMMMTRRYGGGNVHHRTRRVGVNDDAPRPVVNASGYGDLL